MAVFRDPAAPAGRVVFGGVVFIDGQTADIDPGPETRKLFASAEITETEQDSPSVVPAAADIEAPPAEAPAPKKAK